MRGVVLGIRSHVRRHRRHGLSAFDELLNPIHASADLGFTVLRPTDLAADDTFARAAATFYQGAREVKAVLSLPQLLETG